VQLRDGGRGAAAQAAQEEFSRQLIASQEQERQRIAVELHDGLGQSLVIIRNRALLSLSKADDHERAITQIGEISEAATSALLELRQLASSLHPYQIDRLGLASALEEMIARLQDSSEINFTCEIDEVDGALSKEAQINLYRIVQESLNNVIKHSAATASTVQLKKAANRLRLTIQDNGKGFDIAQLANQKHGLGLTGIAERAKVLRTKPEIYSVPGQGTTIYLDIQLENLADET
jgi:signal transduction histidine kinase